VRVRVSENAVFVGNKTSPVLQIEKILWWSISSCPKP
jgi:hypothetical protein